jgi:predicted Na+-dependent transporter
MTLAEMINVLANLATLIFVISSMLALGLSLTVQQILNPLKDVNLVVRALLANFVLVPALAFLLKTMIPLDPSLGIGLILLATAAGAPFLPKLAQAAKADVAFSVGLMVLLMVVTVVYVPVVLPLLLPGVSVNPGGYCPVPDYPDADSPGNWAIRQSSLRGDCRHLATPYGPGLFH